MGLHGTRVVTVREIGAKREKEQKKRKLDLAGQLDSIRSRDRKKRGRVATEVANKSWHKQVATAADYTIAAEL